MSGRKRSRSPLQEIEDDDFDFDDDCSTISKNPPVQRNAANARERARMRVLSSAFCRLKTKLPWVPADTKLSKLDTLRLATIYIQQLRSCLARDDAMHYEEYQGADAKPIGTNHTSLVWPFTFSQNISDSHRTPPNISQWLTRDSRHSNLQDFHSNSSVFDQTSSAMHYDQNHSTRHRTFGSNSIVNHSTAHG